MGLVDRVSGRLRRLIESLPGAKERGELAYWREKKAQEGQLRNDHYKFLFTDHWGLSEEFYSGKRVLDIGCGPRGSLEWAEGALERVGLDSLVKSYQTLGIDQHKMKYVDSGIESAPFPDCYFDIVTSINSLDHVESVEKAIAEIKRITKPGGAFLLLVEVNHAPTVCEPHTMSWSVTEKFLPEFKAIRIRHYEMLGTDMRDSITGPEYDHKKNDGRHGMLSAHFERNA